MNFSPGIYPGLSEEERLAEQVRVLLMDPPEFWRRVAVANTGCWIWTGAQDGGGYGSVWHAGRTWKAHHLALWLSNDDQSNGRCALHSCDVRCCVNPGHLRWGTRADNAQDMVERGRASVRPGELSPRAILTWEDVDYIRERYALGGVRHIDLAERFGVCKATISHILNNRTWKEADRGA